MFISLPIHINSLLHFILLLFVRPLFVELPLAILPTRATIFRGMAELSATHNRQKNVLLLHKQF